jgi:hypothetical protein
VSKRVLISLSAYSFRLSALKQSRAESCRIAIA